MFILQIVISLIFKKTISMRCKYLLLKLSSIFYLLPLPFAKNYYIDILEYFFGNNTFELLKNKTYYPDITLNYENDNFIFAPKYEIITIILIIIYLIIMILLIRQIILYIIFKIRINRCSLKVYNKDMLSILNNEKKTLKIKKEITIKISEDIDTAMTTGFFRPTILIPKKVIKREDLIWIIRHELVHICNYDYVYKIICIIIISIHWYNPFTYFLFKRVSAFSEFNCDEFIVKKINQEQRMQYGFTILKFSAKTNKRPLYKAMSMLGNYNVKIMKARLDNMKHPNEKSKIKSIFQVVLVISATFISSLTVCAYNESEKTPENLSFRSDVLTDTTAYFEYEEPDETEIKLPSLANEKNVNSYFIDEDGNMYEINENKAKAPCNHSYYSGTYTVHTKNGNGCIMDYYNAKRCTKCGNVVLGTRYNTVTYAVCTH